MLNHTPVIWRSAKQGSIALRRAAKQGSIALRRAAAKIYALSGYLRFSLRSEGGGDRERGWRLEPDAGGEPERDRERARG